MVIGGFGWTTFFALGVLAWTLFEYCIHRFFHWKPDPNSENQLLLHFLLHGMHHKTPMDPYRLVLPPAAAALVFGFFYALYVNILPWPVFCAFGSGKLFGYVCYDMIHFYLHHGHPEVHSNMHFRKVYHNHHHFKDYDAGYGISTSLWDYIFRTASMGPI
ncbi:hypothetical protein WR25_06815 [Diploscapter pachys]|uniref:Fatty acid hydroxylase domain-containing protein n=1 Tax=Diploscapter pachys TaxID=2018661 RepID=A0A2A2LN11_9BILA|nr:hypothetical protein WR25_06815 [Diploscapter pachys]